MDRVETNLTEYSDKEEKFMPLCRKCSEDWEEGKLVDIEEKWISEKEKLKYISIDSSVIDEE